MKYKKLARMFLFLFLLAFLTVVLTANVEQIVQHRKYNKMQLTDSWYRNKFCSGEMWKIKDDLSQECRYLLKNAQKEVQYFPIPESENDDTLTISFVDTWQAERNYQGKRGHEGTDIMASENIRGLYPVVSMTDGTVTNIGWLEKGGYRIGITSDSGIYYYYAHLESYAGIRKGDSVKAGQLIGYMGDSGYGPEGTTGKFDVHLHLGIYTYYNGEEISVNPYYILLYLENKKLKYAYS